MNPSSNLCLWSTCMFMHAECSLSRLLLVCGLFPLQEYISMLPGVDHPEAFGQHPNADIASQITETRTLFDTLLSLQPQVSVKQGESRESKVGFLSLSFH